MSETTFDCYVCGEAGSVPFTPKEDATLLCRGCQALYKQSQDEKEQETRRRIPRMAHNTRVSLPITCAECGKNETLTYVPKGVPLTQVRCTDCQSRTLGENSRFVAKAKEIEKERSTALHEVPCDTCGATMMMKKKPWPGREYECESCFKGFARAKDGVIDGAEVVEGTLGMVRKRSKKR